MIAPYTVELNIECSSTSASVIGEAYIWNYLTPENPWIAMETVESASLTYGFNTAVSSDGQYRARQSMRAFLVSSSAVVKQADPTDNQVIKSRIKLRLRNSTNFTARFDLVQLQIPGQFGGVSGSSAASPSQPPQSFALSDTNFDGVIDASDLIQYVEEWIEGVPASDLNIDDSIDGADIDAFVESYQAVGGG